MALAADGLILFDLRDRGATMRLLNADGSPSELSGNGLRCLAALVVKQTASDASGRRVTVETGAGQKTLELLAVERTRYTFRAALGPPADIRQAQIPVLGETADGLGPRRSATRSASCSDRCRTQIASTDSGRRFPLTRCFRPARTSNSRTSSHRIACAS